MSSSRVHRGVDYQGSGSKADGASRQEDRLIALIEAKGTIERYEKHLKRMQKGTLDVTGFMKMAALDASIQLADLMFYGDSDKVRLEAAKEILDRAGYGKTQKVSVSGSVHVDHDTSKLELVNLILASAKKAGIKVKEEEPVFLTSPAAQETIDVTPADTVEIKAKPPEGA